MFSIATKASFKHVRWFITPDNILDVRPFKDFFIQTLAVNNNHNFSSQNKIFIVFWNIGQYPLEFYKQVVKSTNARKWFVFKKSMRKHIFKTSNIFLLYI